MRIEYTLTSDHTGTHSGVIEIDDVEIADLEGYERARHIADTVADDLTDQLTALAS